MIDKIVLNNYTPKKSDQIFVYSGQPFAHDIINKNKLKNIF